MVKIRGNTKRAAILALASKQPEAGPTELTAKLAASGVSVTPNYVSGVLLNFRRHGQVAPAAAVKLHKPRRRRRVNRLAFGPAKLAAAVQLVTTFGGVRQARKVLDTLAQLVGVA